MAFSGGTHLNESRLWKHWSTNGFVKSMKLLKKKSHPPSNLTPFLAVPHLIGIIGTVQKKYKQFQVQFNPAKSLWKVTEEVQLLALMVCRSRTILRRISRNLIRGWTEEVQLQPSMVSRRVCLSLRILRRMKNAICIRLVRSKWIYHRISNVDPIGLTICSFGWRTRGASGLVNICLYTHKTCYIYHIFMQNPR